MTTAYDRWAALAERESVGDALLPEERAFLQEYPATDPLAATELALFDSLASLGVGTTLDTATDHALADRAVQQALSGSSRQPTELAARGRHKTRWLVWGIASAAAAAAAVAVFVRSPSGLQPPAGGSIIEYVAAQVQVAGQGVSAGAHADVGSEVVALGGPACVAVEPHIHACLADGAKLRLSAVGQGKRRLDLLAGRVAMALDPLPPAERLSVVANGVWSTAVGTAFTVELLADGSVRTVVHEGKVAVGSESATDVVDFHKIGLTTGGGAVQVEPPTAHATLETADWVALARVAKRSIEGPTAEFAVAPSQAEGAVAVPQPETIARHAHLAPPAAAHAPKAEAEEAAPEATSASLLAAARQALREQRWSDAGGSYRKLIDTFPSTPEAHTVLVSLAKLELDRLGQPAAALQHLDAYLGHGGPLALEAKLAKVKAYRLLGRRSEEAAAIDDVLAANPSGLEVDQLRKRREELAR
jgi:tetratricopeptide (TPR) repeat protein